MRGPRDQIKRRGRIANSVVERNIGGAEKETEQVPRFARDDNSPYLMTTRSLLLAIVTALTSAACDERRGDDGETPYAARLAKSKPPYVRPAVATKATPPAALAPEVFAEPQFTAQQAAAGAEVYKATCARCHASAQWTGSIFAATWRDRRLSDFHDLVVTTMPQDNPGGLAPQQYIDVTAYVMQLAGFSAGSVPLRSDSVMLRHARITIKTPAPIDSSGRK
jgi:mono/diheme cytochrome c family protein